MLETFLEVDLESPWACLGRLNKVDVILYFAYGNIGSNYHFVARISCITLYLITQRYILTGKILQQQIYMHEETVRCHETYDNEFLILPRSPDKSFILLEIFQCKREKERCGHFIYSYA